MENKNPAEDKQPENKSTGLPKDDATYMAVERTVMSADRSQMAWLRTGLSLISFGFTIYKFLEYQVEQIVALGKEVKGPSSPKMTGLILIGLGVICVVLGIVEYLSVVTEYRKKFKITRPAYSLYVSALIALIGTILFFGIIFNTRGIG